ncbi:butyrophilin subfamily 1 member A1-like [Siphateles boraxobius]|uniref:butyrophilin subfamily 1 member A1-like n=1 Tax=Siphateles boraxobius TaxID=180520 RepID=UPI00406367A1
MLTHPKNTTNDERDQLLQSQKVILPKALPHLRSHTVNVTLDADSAHPHLIVSDDGKQVKCVNRLKELNAVDEGTDRFEYYLGVLGKDGFSSGSFYFEVQVKDQTKWDLGVARESSNKRGKLGLSPGVGYWTVRRRSKRYWALDSPHSVPLPLGVEPQRVGVFVDYEKGLVSFYEVESMSHIYTYTSQSFNKKLYPCIGFEYQWKWKNENSTPLIICDDN